MNINRLIKEFPILDKMLKFEEICWENEKILPFDDINFEIELEEINEASERLKRFASYIKVVFKNEGFNGIIESPIKKIDKMKNEMIDNILGDLYIKKDNLLPISGSIKARGGIYEVLKHAEDLLIKENMIEFSNDYEILTQEKFKKFFSLYTISVGSTGNLGMSIGIMGKTLGFNVEVHMSADAKQWKKDLLRKIGAKVFEYEDDYSKAVKEGREKANSEKNNYFIDDENSKNLFLGYSVAALRLKKQFEDKDIEISKDNPLLVYIPCGVGGGPSGIAYGLKYIFKDNVKIYFIEPTHSPCMALSMITGLENNISVLDIGIDNKTEADGLAVGRASKLAARTMKYILNGIYTIDDDKLFNYLRLAYEKENIKLEPSAAAGFIGVEKNKDLLGNHLVWATGGSLVPEKEFKKYLNKNK